MFSLLWTFHLRIHRFLNRLWSLSTNDLTVFYLRRRNIISLAFKKFFFWKITFKTFFFSLSFHFHTLHKAVQRERPWPYLLEQNRIAPSVYQELLLRMSSRNIVSLLVLESFLFVPRRWHVSLVSSWLLLSSLLKNEGGRRLVLATWMEGWPSLLRCWIRFEEIWSIVFY